MKSDIFISYRRSKDGKETDSAVSLKTNLQRRLTGKSIYLDVHGAPTGETIQGDILKLTRASQVFVIAINSTWNDTVERLQNPNDYVRLEIELALSLDLNIMPIVLSDGRLPTIDELPESLRGILDRQATFVSNYETYDNAIDDFARAIKMVSPNTTVRALNWLTENDAANIVFGLVILGGLMLFLSRILNIHLFTFTTEVEASLGSIEAFGAIIEREVGVIMAWNWTVVVIVITPMMALIACNTLKITKEFFDNLQVKQMIFYVGNKGQQTPITARRLWDTIINPTSIWCQAFVIIAIVLGVVQWWQYSGQWYFKGFDLTNFMQESTGPDWHVAWALGIDRLADSGGSTIVFALLMYLVYGIGSAITFSFYAFLFNFSSKLSHLATSVGATAKSVLMLDINDQQNGGLEALKRIQTYHATFCYWSLAAMYVMALRNAYLPLVCRIPDGISSSFDNQEAMLEQCTTMGNFVFMIFLSFQHFFSSLLEGQPDFGILFFTYSAQNHFVLGSMLYVLLIASFFFLISVRMKTIIESAQSNANSEIAMNLIRQLSFENVRVLSILFLGALSTVFLNLGLFVLILALSLMVVHRIMHGSMT